MGWAIGVLVGGVDGRGQHGILLMNGVGRSDFWRTGKKLYKLNSSGNGAVAIGSMRPHPTLGA